MGTPAFQSLIPLRSFCLSVSGAVAPSAPALPCGTANLSRRDRLIQVTRIVEGHVALSTALALALALTNPAFGSSAIKGWGAFECGSDMD